MIGIETERKFLVTDDRYKKESIRSEEMVQAYLCCDAKKTIRLRICEDKAYLTIKGPSSRDGLSRIEWETPIDCNEARVLLQLCLPGQLTKRRYYVPCNNGLCFEVDEFYGDNQGLVMAEIELPNTHTPFDRPDWLGREVTGDKRFYNASLSHLSYKEFKASLTED